MGAIKRPFYRIIVADSRSPRDGRFIETLGYYNPCVEPIVLKIDPERANYWLGVGAQPSETASALLKREGLIERSTKQAHARQVAAKTASAAAAAAKSE
jgi:small subunit ribosomal protein S16